MTDSEQNPGQPLGKINPVKMRQNQTKEYRPNQAEADMSSPVQQKMEKSSLGKATELISAQTERLLITDDEDMPVHKHYILFGTLFFFIAFMVWGNWAVLDEVTRGMGKVIPSSETKSLQSLEGGIVDKFMVREGEQVKKGQPLILLRDVEATSDLGANQQRYYGLLATIARLQAEAEGLAAPVFSDEVLKAAPSSVSEEMNAFKANRTRLDSQKIVLEQQLSQRRQEVNEITGRMSDMRGLLSSAQEEKAMIAPLVEKGSAPRLELLQLDRSIKERQTELNGLQTSLPRARAAVEEAQARLKETENNVKAEAQTELSAKTIELNSIRETLGALQDRKTRTEIISPVDGFVQDIKVNTVGGVVKPGDDIIVIVPLDDNLLIETQIRPGDIGFLSPGMKAMVKITAYDYSIYGGLKGEVLDISPDTIKDERGEIFYRVKIKTYENRLKSKKNKDLPIKVGMVTSVDILTGEKTVMQYLMKPLLKTVDNAMKER